MSDHIPFEIQSEIIKSLPVKSIIQFRSVSKQWKAFIDDPKFINNYHINHTNPQHHLLVQYDYQLDNVKTFTSIIDNNTFPKQKLSLTTPDSLGLLRGTLTLSSSDGLICFCGFYNDVYPDTRMAVIWNPAVRKSVGIFIPNLEAMYTRTIVGFGVFPDPKLVKISVSEIPSRWEVDVFTLSTRVWKTVCTGPPFKLCDLSWVQVFVNGVIYFRAYDDISKPAHTLIPVSFQSSSGTRGDSSHFQSKVFDGLRSPGFFVHSIYYQPAHTLIPVPFQSSSGTHGDSSHFQSKVADSKRAKRFT